MVICRDHDGIVCGHKCDRMCKTVYIGKRAKLFGQMLRRLLRELAGDSIVQSIAY